MDWGFSTVEDEKHSLHPSHRVTLTSPLFMEVTPLTLLLQLQKEAICMGRLLPGQSHTLLSPRTVVVPQIREELRANGIDVYPQKEFDEDAEDRMINDKIRVI
jgi:hypothetical protein